jgi:diazepam-binding inhibitor (GABA receptor modulating acyl-CoA-binding protein)
MFGLNKLEATFRDAANEMTQLPEVVASTIGQAHRLEYYGYYKHATIGDNASPQPQFLNQKSNSKWWAWKQCTGMTREEAMKRYIEVTEAYRTKQKH